MVVLIDVKKKAFGKIQNLFLIKNTKETQDLIEFIICI
jgi:hypothetical protein